MIHAAYTGDLFVPSKRSHFLDVMVESARLAE